MQMTIPGAVGNTREQILSALKIDNQDSTFKNSQSLQETLKNDQSVSCTVANSLWINNKFAVQDEYIKTVKEYFSSEVFQSDFTYKPDKERLKINSWVSNKTNDKINDILAPGTVASSTRLILVNAIYFLGKWANEFNPESTRTSDFFVSPNEKISTKFMSQTAQYPYFEDNQLQMLSLPYSGNTFVMDILLPKTDLSSLEQNITVDYYNSINLQLNKRKVTAQIPKFKSELSFNLSQSLSSLGIKDAFQYGLADFSKISDSKDLYISDVIHKAFIEVGEKGTEAAAATAIIMRVGSIRPVDEDKPILFRADKPFMYVIRHTPTDTIVFMGRIKNPT
jgi:serpin B